MQWANNAQGPSSHTAWDCPGPGFAGQVPRASGDAWRYVAWPSMEPLQRPWPEIYSPTLQTSGKTRSRSEARWPILKLWSFKNLITSVFANFYPMETVYAS